MTHTTTPMAIPEPRRFPVLKHLLSIDTDKPVQSMIALAKDLGPMYRIAFPGSKDFLVLNSFALVDEACDESRFAKTVPTALLRLREVAHDALFTAHNHEPNWGKAHRILMPAFGMEAMRGYHTMMLDIATQMVDKWARLPQGQEIDVSADMTRLTLDVIALCGFDYRFNSFYRSDMHPFVNSMVRTLTEAMDSDNRPQFINQFMRKRRLQFAQDIDQMHAVVDAVIAIRKQQPHSTASRDLLSLMLHAKDPETGETLDDENIRNQIVTFLIAGHETTSSLLAFTLYYLMQHPALLRRAQHEIDAILPDPTQLPSYDDIRQLQFVEQLLYESLRLWPTAPAFVLQAKETTTLGGYRITPEENLFVNLTSLHRDPEIWDDPERFDPERFTPEAIAARPANAWKPFGNGMRACIGRQFAIQEAKLALALILRRFDIEASDPDAPLDIRETLTFKPEGLYMRVSLRKGLTLDDLITKQRIKSSPKASNNETSAVHGQVATITQHQTPLLIGFGSNLGSTKSIAEALAAESRAMGYDVTLSTLDDCVDQLPTKGAFLAISASYNGHPPDNARQFYAWLQALPNDALQDVHFAVLGCGHRDWAATYQAVPIQIDQALANAGATRLSERGEADARVDLMQDVRVWSGAFWPQLHAHAEIVLPSPSTEALPQATWDIEEFVSPERKGYLPEDAVPMRVIENRELVVLSAPHARSKRHLTIALPAGQSYHTGDYLVVQPTNDKVYVETFAAALGWDLEKVVILRTTGPATLPLNKPISLRALLTRHIELQHPLTQQHLTQLAEHAACPPERVKLLDWPRPNDTQPEGSDHVAAQKLRLLDLLHACPSLRPSLAVILDLLPSIQPRYYSISSAPEHDKKRCSLTMSVLTQPSQSGRGTFRGVCSHYLASRKPNDTILAWVRRPQSSFAPPVDSQRPMIMIAAGTGIAPFRGFLQQRASEQQQGSKPAPSLLFFGCDHPNVDFLYREELETWASQGLVSVYPAFSEQHDSEIRFVQHRLWQERRTVLAQLGAGASIYLCGDGRYMAPAVRETLCRIYLEAHRCSTEEAASWLDTLREAERLHEDVWAG